MGNSNSSQIANTLSQNISSSVMSTLQSVNTNVSAYNKIFASCDPGVAKQLGDNCLSGVLKAIEICKTDEKCTDEMKSFLKQTACSGCLISDIDISNDVVVASTNYIDETMDTNINNSIDQNLTQSLKDTSGSQVSKSDVNNISSVVMSTLQDIQTNASAINIINTSNISV